MFVQTAVSFRLRAGSPSVFTIAHLEVFNAVPLLLISTDFLFELLIQTAVVSDCSYHEMKRKTLKDFWANSAKQRKTGLFTQSFKVIS
jgi:hypothetical protein